MSELVNLSNFRSSRLRRPTRGFALATPGTTLTESSSRQGRDSATGSPVAPRPKLSEFELFRLRYIELREALERAGRDPWRMYL